MLFIIVLIYLSCSCSCAKIYNHIEDTWLSDDIYKNGLQTGRKLSQQDFTYFLNNEAQHEHNYKKLMKRGAAHSSYLEEQHSSIPRAVYEFQPQTTFTGYALPIISKQKFYCNINAGCTVTLTDTFTSSTSISMNGDISIPLNFGTLKIGAGEVKTETTTKTCTVAWKLNFGESGGVGIYPLTKFTFGKTIKTIERIYLTHGGFRVNTIEDHREEYETCIQTPIIGDDNQMGGIQAFFYN